MEVGWLHFKGSGAYALGLLKSMIRTWKVDLVCLLKTEVQEMLLCVVRSLGVGRFLNWGTIDARVALGGILIF